MGSMVSRSWRFFFRLRGRLEIDDGEVKEPQ
jgi:hypothetical protein